MKEVSETPACRASEWTPVYSFLRHPRLSGCRVHGCSSCSVCVRSPEGSGMDSPAWASVVSGRRWPCPPLLQAEDSRDSLAMALYARCFEWVIKKINSRIKGKDDFKSIGILDIFGFENFEVCFSWVGCMNFFLSTYWLKSLHMNTRIFLCRFFSFLPVLHLCM